MIDIRVCFQILMQCLKDNDTIKHTVLPAPLPPSNPNTSPAMIRLQSVRDQHNTWTPPLLVLACHGGDVLKLTGPSRSIHQCQGLLTCSDTERNIVHRYFFGDLGGSRIYFSDSAADVIRLDTSSNAHHNFA